MLFGNSFEIAEKCLHQFDKIGIMDLQGDGALIRNPSKRGLQSKFKSQIDMKSPQNLLIDNSQ